ncbi:MAG: nitroreductase family deazaflavin-dependent oxidoreductase [Caldilineaceae bacterium]
MSSNTERYARPSTIAVLVNKLIGKLATWGLGPSYMVQLTVRGRKSGKLYSTPVNLLNVDGNEYLVAPRGTTSWVRNARAVGEVTLTQKRNSQTVQLQEVPNEAKPPLLKAYLEQYKSAVQQYFAVEAGADVNEFAAIVDDHPVFRIIRHK